MPILVKYLSMKDSLEDFQKRAKLGIFFSEEKERQEEEKEQEQEQEDEDEFVLVTTKDVIRGEAQQNDWGVIVALVGEKNRGKT